MKNALILSICLALAGPVYAQTVGETSGVNAALDIAPKTGDFISDAAASEMFELAASKLAAERATGDVQNFAKEMVADHTKTTDELKGLAKSAKVSLPITMTGSGQSMLTKLKDLQGQEFNKEYINDQVSAHQDAVSMFERYGKSGENEQLKNWANQTLPTLRHHLEMAQNISGKL